MERVFLKRLESTDSGTFGRVTVDKKGFFSAELPWRDNEPMLSCIPEGVYECAWEFSPRFSRFTYLVQGVVGRAGIRFHPANHVGDESLGLKTESQGCISLGLAIGFLHGQRAVLASAKAVRIFENYMAQEPFILKIYS